jgi:hypothetical protein
MSIDEAAKILSQMYNSALEGDQVLQIHLFGIKYSDELHGLPLSEIAVRARLPKSYGTEINKGRNLARYVSLKA